MGKGLVRGGDGGDHIANMGSIKLWNAVAVAIEPARGLAKNVHLAGLVDRSQQRNKQQPSIGYGGGFIEDV